MRVAVAVALLAVLVSVASCLDVHYEQGVALLATLPGGSCSAPLAVFAKEFVHSLDHFVEITTAVVATFRHNPCQLHRFVVSQPDDAGYLKQLHDKHPVDMQIFFAPQVTYTALLEAATYRLPASVSVFVTGTLDVEIGNVSKLHQACGPAFDPRRPLLLVASRTERGQPCQYYKEQGSWDVLVGHTSLITEQAKRSSVLSPAYHGSENVVAFNLVAGDSARVYNLCPHWQVFHHHQSPVERSDVIKISHGTNSFNGHNNGDAGSICTIKALK